MVNVPGIVPTVHFSSFKDFNQKEKKVVTNRALK